MARHWRELAPQGPLGPAEYAQPYAWWGWHWSPPVPMSIVEIVEAGTIDRRIAALLWMLVESRRSILLASEPPMSGKTTVLSALVSFLDARTQPVFLRGLSETFDYARVLDPARSYLLVNELSSHLPVYLWGAKAARMFRTLAQGFGLGATMHANDVDEVLAELRGELGLTTDDLARLDVIGIMRTYAGGEVIRGHDDVPPEMRYGVAAVRRRLSSLHLVVPDGDALRTPTLSEWDPATGEHRLALEPHLRDLARRTGRSVERLCDELVARDAFLDDLAQRGIRRPAAVHDAVAAYRGGTR